MLGSLEIEVTYKAQENILPLLVVASTDPSLLGQDWMLSICLDWKELNPKLNLYSLQSAHKSALQSMLDHHAQIFEDELSKVKGVTAKIFICPKATPRFYKPCSVPYDLKSKVDQELESLETAGVIRPVQFAEWAAPIVPILKRGGSIRMCGDYKITVNIFASLTGGKSFSKLDMAHAYQQIPLEESSKKLVVINTQKVFFSTIDFLLVSHLHLPYFNIQWRHLERYSTCISLLRRHLCNWKFTRRASE